MKNSKGFINLFLIITLFLFVGCAKPPSDNVEINDEAVIEDSILKVAVFDFPPYMNVEGNEYTGPAIEVMHETFSRIGYKENVDYRVVVYPWLRTLEMAKTGEIDMIAEILKSPERYEYLDYTNEYHVSEQMVFITLKNSDIIYNGDLNSMSNLTFGTIRGFKYGTKFDQAVQEGIISIDSSENAYTNIGKLLTARVEIIVEVKEVALAVLKENDELEKIEILDPPLIDNYSYFAFAKVNSLTELRAEFDQKLKELREDGTEEKIYSNYFNRE